MSRITSGGFTTRDEATHKFIDALNEFILSPDRYLKIETGIEHRFGDEAQEVHSRLYKALGPTTDLLRYFPDSLCFDLRWYFPDWETELEGPKKFASTDNVDNIGNFTFFVEYKYSGTKRKYPLRDRPDVPTEYVGIIEREAWLTYKRLTSPNVDLGTYLDGRSPRIALFYAASYAPAKIYAGWEGQIEPINVVTEIAKPGTRAMNTRGSGTPWINFDIRSLKPLEQFLNEDLFWDITEANEATNKCKAKLFA